MHICMKLAKHLQIRHSLFCLLQTAEYNYLQLSMHTSVN